MENKYNYVPLSEIVKAANLKNEISLSAYHNSMVDLWDMFGRPNPEPIVTEDIDHEVIQPKCITDGETVKYPNWKPDKPWDTSMPTEGTPMIMSKENIDKINDAIFPPNK